MIHLFEIVCKIITTLGLDVKMTCNLKLPKLQCRLVRVLQKTLAQLARIHAWLFTHSELHVLQVRQVHELSIFLVNHAHSLPVSSPVLPHVIADEDHGQGNGHSIGNEDCNLRGNVLWCILISEGQWTKNVTQTERSVEKRLGRRNNVEVAILT